MLAADDFRDIRTWRGTQPNAWEELCYQLRDPPPPGSEERKIGNPDAGIEWHVLHRNGVQWGWQAKYSFNVDTLLGLMETSLRTVVDKRPEIRRLTFCIPVDLPDARTGRGKSARQRFEDAKASWRQRIAGAERVRIDLWQAGDILQRLNAPEHRGKQWFFWERELFDVPWCAGMLEIVERAAGERYTPEAHVELPVGRAIDGLARSAWLAERFTARQEEVRVRTERLNASQGTGLGVARAVAHARQLANEWQTAFDAVDIRSGRGLDVGALTELTQRASSACSAADPPPAKRKQDRQRAEGLRHRLWQCELAYTEMLQLLRSGATRAAEAGVLLLKGDAGQGKTHLLIDGAGRLVRKGQPAAVLLASRVDPNAPWTSIAEAFGVPASGRDALLGAMEAAGEAAGAPFVLAIDALNERPDAKVWADALPVLLAELARTPWVVLAVSVRSGYEPLVLPEGGLRGRAAIVLHEGFVQREAEALESYFEHYGIEQPRVPLLSAEFTNPLFLKLYCESLQERGASAAPLGHRHLTEVFDSYVAGRLRRVTRALKLDPGGSAADDALRAFALALADRGTDAMERGDAAALLDPFAPQRVEWPDTMLGRMLDEGVLADDLTYERREGKTQRTRVVRFTYQRLADHSIVGHVLGQIRDADALQDELRPGAPLRKWIIEAPSGWLQALSMQVPERFGLELVDATEWRMRKGGRRVLLSELVDGLSWREPSSITLRTTALVEEAAKLDDHLAASVEETMLGVAAMPEHPLNAERLHMALATQPMPDRDAGWGIRMYDAHTNGGALERLARWAARGPHPAAPDEVIDLAALPLMWMLGSPNRFARDHITKALGALLRDRLRAAAMLLERVVAVNDPYIIERVAVIVHGVLLSSRDATAIEINVLCGRLRTLLTLTERRSVPNILTRDAIRGAHEWARRNGFSAGEHLGSVSPPYGASAPERLRMDLPEKEFEKQYCDEDYGALVSSLFYLGDFGRYVVDSRLRHFTRTPLSEPAPKRPRGRWKRDDALIAEIEETWPTERLALLRDYDDFELLGLLTKEELDTWHAAKTWVPPARSERVEYPTPEARRWVFLRVLELGWTPERFGTFDMHHGHGRGREGHKAERFGKKYQWIALHELLARVADNYWMRPDHDDSVVDYVGPWQLSSRDIDPTLPPRLPSYDAEDDEVLCEPFADEVGNPWWVPSCPAVEQARAPSEEWAEASDGEPAERELFVCRDEDGREWAVLKAYRRWEDGRIDDEKERLRREIWHHVYGWFVGRGDAQRLVRFLRTRSLMNEWMPMGPSITNVAYIGEMPWALAAEEEHGGWQQARRFDDKRGGPDVLPVAAEYFWEGNVWDCSLTHGVRVLTPGRDLFEAGRLRWRPATRCWEDRLGSVVVQHVATEGHEMLLADTAWLHRVLEQEGWELVLGLLGERQLFRTGLRSELVRGWTELNGAATYEGGAWRIGSVRRSYSPLQQ